MIKAVIKRSVFFDLFNNSFPVFCVIIERNGERQYVGYFSYKKAVRYYKSVLAEIIRPQFIDHDSEWYYFYHNLYKDMKL
jgi:hypothetical protein